MAEVVAASRSSGDLGLSASRALVRGEVVFRSAAAAVSIFRPGACKMCGRGAKRGEAPLCEACSGRHGVVAALYPAGGGASHAAKEQRELALGLREDLATEAAMVLDAFHRRLTHTADACIR